MQNTVMAIVEKGKVCRFSLALRNQDGTEDVSWAPDRFDVIRNSTGAVAYLDQELEVISNYDGKIRVGMIDTGLAAFVPGEQYTILIKVGEGTEPTLFQTYQMCVIGSLTENTRVIMEQSEYLRNDIENVIFPRLKRLLSHAGENILMDKFVFDSANNITGLRVRIFDLKANCEAATQDISDDDIPEAGEVATYVVTQEHSLPRSVRTLHRSTPVVEPEDVPVTDNQAPVPVFAPGNEGGWPIP